MFFGWVCALYHFGVMSPPRSPRQQYGVRKRQAAQAIGWAAARVLLIVGIERNSSMSVVRILGFSTLSCGCVVGRYRDIASTREVVYAEEKGVGCESHAHRRNHTVSAERERFAAVSLTTLTAARAS